MRAADALCQALTNEGVEHVFGIPGGANLPLYDAIYDAEFAHIQARHEQGAGHMAEGYAKASGRVGVAIATSGPGATNLVTPIADAMMDSVPTVFITGQVRTDLIGTDGFQEADVVGITLPVVKHSLLVTDPRQIPDYIHKAFHIASTGRPGPVLVDVPQDLIRADIDYTPATGSPELPGYKPSTDGNIKQIRIAAKALANSKRPVIYGGGGIINANASEEFREFCRTDELPVTLTVMGLGAFPAPDEQWLGMLGMHGTRTANYAMDEADLIVCVGARFDDRITGKLSEFAPRAKFVHIDIDPAEIGKNLPAHIPIVGDAKDVLTKLAARVQGAQPRARAPRRVVAADPRLAVRAPAPLRGLLGFRDQAAVHGRVDVRGDLGRRDHHFRRRPAPDVGGAVLPLRKAAPLAELRRPGHDGLRPSLGDRRQGRVPRRDGRRPHRRRLADHDLPGDGDGCAPQHPREDVPDEQRPLRHGAPVAGALLGEALLLGRDGPEPRLVEARRRLRLDRHALRRQGRPARRDEVPRSRRTARSSWTSTSPRKRTATR